MKLVKYHLILNPRSRGGKSAGKFDYIFGLLKEAGLEYDYVFADSYEKIREASAKANAGDCDVIVAVGGDGTINATINGFYNENGSGYPQKILGVIYTGTSPDFCKSYGIPLDLTRAVEAIRMLNVRNIRIGKIRLVTCVEPLRVETRYFSCCASIGIGATVAGKANRYRKFVGDTIGTLAAIISSLVKFHPVELVVKLDSIEKTVPLVTNIFVGRTKYIASGLKVNEEIADDDKRFYILCVNKLNIRRLPGLLKQLYSGNMVNSPVLEFSYSENLSIRSAQGTVEVEFDGDPAGFTPCTITAATAPLKLIVNPHDH